MRDRLTKRITRGEKGQALVELALVSPILLLLLFAIIEFGIMLSDYSTLVNASRAGARALALGVNSSDPCDAAVNAAVASASGQFTIPTSDVTPSFPAAGQASADEDFCGSANGTYDGCTYQYQVSCNANGQETPGDEAQVTITYSFPFKVFGLKFTNINLSTTSTEAIE